MIYFGKVSFYLGGEKLKNIYRIFFYFTRPVFSGRLIRPLAALLMIFLCLSALSPSALSAQEAGEAPENIPESSILLGGETPGLSPPPPGASISLILRMLLILLLAAAAIYGVVYFLKRSSRPLEQRDPNVRLLSSVHLGSNRFVHVVAVGTRVWFLGASDGGVNLITEIEDQDAINALFLEESRKSAQRGGKIQDFKALLRRLGLPLDNRVPGADDIRKRRDRLKGFK
jgi:flagellar protein FliO/FliZ